MIHKPNTASTSPKKWNTTDRNDTGGRSSGCITRYPDF